nr:efflux RND transporter periplasmic adaptor subunit [Erythrobacter sp. SN021]
MNSRKGLYIGAGLVVLLVAVAAVIWFVRPDPHEQEGHLVLNGNVDIRQVNLGFKVSGRIETLVFDEGDRVVVGDLLASLEPQDYENEIALAEARASQRSAAVAALEAGSRPEEIERARARVAEAESALDVAQATLDRVEHLAQRGFASRQTQDEALSKRNRAAAQRQAALEEFSLTRQGPRREEIQQGRAALGAERAAASLARQRLVDANLYAPSDGIILTRAREAGAIVGPGETVFTLAHTSPMWIRAYIEEPDLERADLGAPVTVLTEGARKFRGRIAYISPTAEFTPKSVETREQRTSLVYRIRVRVEDQTGILKQGMPVSVIVRPNDRES